jgi:hypothetical protein
MVVEKTQTYFPFVFKYAEGYVFKYANGASGYSVHHLPSSEVPQQQLRVR